MSAVSKIQWTDRTWNPVRGCSVVSPGCVNCYAMKQAHRFSGPGKPYDGLTKQTKAGPQWTGKIATVDAALLEPLSWRQPARVFVNSMSDLFHEGVPYDFIVRVFATMQQAHRHTFQILTKRAERMRDLVSRPSFHSDVSGCAGIAPIPWPLPNVWLGVSVEDQGHADVRIPLLLQTPAAVRFISAEPLLGPVDLDRGGFTLLERIKSPSGTVWPGLDWVIVGGESGPGARHFNLEWARSIIGQCKRAGVAVFVKQLGAKPYIQYQVNGGTFTNPMCRPEDGKLSDRKGGDMAEWPADLRVREFPGEAAS